VEVFICRDIDSPPSLRDRWAVEAFVRSPAGAHAVSDHPQHGIPMAAGMIGFKHDAFTRVAGRVSFDTLLGSYRTDRWDVKGADQEFLNSVLWPRIARDTLEHRIKGYPGWSTALRTIEPCDVGVVPGLADIDKFSPFLGIPGYDNDALIAFLSDFDLPTSRRIAEIERGAA
jgi:hypothetical protein